MFAEFSHRRLVAALIIVSNASLAYAFFLFFMEGQRHFINGIGPIPFLLFGLICYSATFLFRRRLILKSRIAFSASLLLFGLPVVFVLGVFANSIGIGVDLEKYSDRSYIGLLVITVVGVLFRLTMFAIKEVPLSSQQNWPAGGNK